MSSELDIAKANMKWTLRRKIQGLDRAIRHHNNIPPLVHFLKAQRAMFSAMLKEESPETVQKLKEEAFDTASNTVNALNAMRNFVRHKAEKKAEKLTDALLEALNEIKEDLTFLSECVDNYLY
jgi:uncharacterized protein YcbK (DUF882 family)